MNTNKSNVISKTANRKINTQYNELNIIKLLEFLRDQKGHPIHVEKIRQQFKNDRAINHYLGLLWPEKETEYIKKAYPEDENCRDYIISEQGLFKLFDYEQLKLTRKISIIAIIIAVFSIVASITVSIFQIVS